MRHSLIALFLLGVMVASATPGFAAPFQITTLASNVTDPGLINAWGLASSATSPFWIGANGSQTAEVYTGAGTKLGLVVTIPGDGSVTGVGFNFNSATSFNNDLFLFASEDGTFSGWKGALGTTAEVLQAGSTANVYKGLAIGTANGSTYSYLANFRNGRIDVVKGTAAAQDLTGSFLDPGLPAGYAPFDVQNLGGTLYVTYALQDVAKHDDVPGPGHGIVDAFDSNGNFLRRVATDGALDSPWGLALAPSGFGGLGGDLLVGNFGDGTIDVYDPSGGGQLGVLRDINDLPLVIDGLWGLRFGNGGNGGDPNTLYFTAGPADETQGQFGSVAPVGAQATVPEPATVVLVGSGLLGAAFRRRRAARAQTDLV
jgi:uncharacterized protein (TIGR03118 family)